MKLDTFQTELNDRQIEYLKTLELGHNLLEAVSLRICEGEYDQKMFKNARRCVRKIINRFTLDYTVIPVADNEDEYIIHPHCNFMLSFIANYKDGTIDKTQIRWKVFSVESVSLVGGNYNTVVLEDYADLERATKHYKWLANTRCNDYKNYYQLRCNYCAKNISFYKPLELYFYPIIVDSSGIAPSYYADKIIEFKIVESSFKDKEALWN